MKKILLLIFVTLLVTINESFAQINIEKRGAFREAVERGEQIFRGIILAQKCKIFEQSEYNLFESKAKAIVGVIKKVLVKKGKRNGPASASGNNDKTIY